VDEGALAVVLAHSNPSSRHAHLSARRQRSAS
jgi:hypothetical protein